MATQVGEASVALKFETKNAAAQLKSDTTDALKSVEGSLARARNSFSTWGVAVGTIVGNAFSRVATIVSDSLEGGITRFDTINRFPKVMEAIGYSAQEASESVLDVWQYVQGLPTPFNEALSAVQRLASSTESLEDATRVYKAMNNALLSGGADIQRQSQVMTQWLQSVSRGKFVGQEWNDMMEVMPGVMNAATKDLIGTKAGAEQLRDAMATGKITMRDFLDEIIKLDDEGSGSFTSLAEQAKINTEGVSTSLTTMRQSIENIWMNVMKAIGSDNIQKALGLVEDGIDAIGDALVGLVKYIKQVVALASAAWDSAQPIFAKVVEWFNANILPAIQAVIDWAKANIVPAVQSIFSKIGPIVGKIIELIRNVWTTVTEVVGALMPVITPVVDSIVAFIGGVIHTIVGLVDNLLSIIDGLLGAAVWTWGNIISPIVSFVSGIINSIATVVQGFLSRVQAILTAMVNAWSSAFNNVKNFVSGAVNAIVSFVTGIPGRVSGAINSVRNIFTNAFNSAKNAVSGAVNAIVGFVTGIPGRVGGKISEITGKFVQAFEEIKRVVKEAVDAVVGFVTSIPSRIGDIGGQIGGAISSGVSGAISSAQSAIEGLLSNIPGLATGGYVHATPGGTLAVIGEGGEDEFVIPRSQMIDILTGVATRPLPELKAENMRVDGGGVVVYNTYEINSALDADDIGRRINNSIRLATL